MHEAAFESSINRVLRFYGLTNEKNHAILSVLQHVIHLVRSDTVISLDYRDSRSLHEQIESGIRELIISGIMKPEEKLPSVRELSVSLTVNPNTVQKAYRKLELDGFIYSVKGRGNFVARAKDVKQTLRTKELYITLEKAVTELKFLGESSENIELFVKNICMKKEENQ